MGIAGDCHSNKSIARLYFTKSICRKCCENNPARGKLASVEGVRVD